MKITKLGHSCLLVEMPDPVGRTALFDPGVYSDVIVETLLFLDDIIITHIHSDHFNLELVKRLVSRFPAVRITAPVEVVERLNVEGIAATSATGQGVMPFESPHEPISPLLPYDPPQEIGVHYLDTLTHPGDSHSFSETKAILALPVQAPWGSTNAAVKLALELKPQYVIPIHDWHWNDKARAGMYASMERVFSQNGITWIGPDDGQPFEINI